MITRRRIKNPKLRNTDRLPTVAECEKCKYQDECHAGKYCVTSKRKGQPQIHNSVVDKRSDKGVKRKCKTM